MWINKVHFVTKCVAMVMERCPLGYNDKILSHFGGYFPSRGKETNSNEAESSSVLEVPSG